MIAATLSASFLCTTLKGLAAYSMEEGDSGRKREAPQESGPAQKKKRLFIRELKYMMHGFGDDPNPHTG